MEDGIRGGVAVVTGAGRGIGAAVAEALASAGATVAAIDLDADGLARTAERANGAGVADRVGIAGDATGAGGAAGAGGAEFAEGAGGAAAANSAGGAVGADRVGSAGDAAGASGAADAGGADSAGGAGSAAGPGVPDGTGNVSGSAAGTGGASGEGGTGGASGIGSASGTASTGVPGGASGFEAGRAAGRIVPFLADVADSAAIARVVDEVERELGPITIGVPVAGILRPASVVETTDEDWAATFAVNTTGVFTVLREVSRRMVPRRAGVLVTVGSNAAGVPRTGMAAYAASKAAATMLTRCLGLELAGSGIRCNVVSPGSTDTGMQRMLWADEHGAARVIAGDPEQFRAGIPLGRIADPGDIADAVLFLASTRARHITMQNLYVDGGATLRA